MHLASLQLTHFKNYPTLQHTFSSNLNLIIGPNGTGKTNLLDAIHYLCNTKSAFLSSDQLAIQHEQDFFRIEGHFEEEGKPVKVECMCQKENGKTFLVDGKASEKLSAYIGRFPLVLVSPYDTDLIREGSETRRRFFDLVLSQSNQEYLEKLMTYNRLLKQRNALLKQFAESGRNNISLLSVYDEQLLPLNQFISTERSAFVGQFLPQVSKEYRKLAETSETPHIQYRSECVEEDFAQRFLENQRNDLLAQRTILGIHTDDYEFTLNETALKRYGSQGQQKTFVLALKLAHFQFLYSIRQRKPLLLLDDIFDRLDDTRVSNLAQMVNGGAFGQVFITDATPKRIQELFGTNKKEMATFKTQ
jgi:DNA replication and repair protein RecF